MISYKKQLKNSLLGVKKQHVDRFLFRRNAGLTCAAPGIGGKTVHLPADGTVVLLASGSIGCGLIKKLYRLLSEGLPENSTVVVACGHNRKLFQELSALPKHGRNRILGFTDRMPDYMDATDAFSSKAGGISITEAMAKGVPLLLLNAIGCCETYDFCFMTQRGLALGADTAGEAAGLILSDAFEVREPAVPRQNGGEAIFKAVHTLWGEPDISYISRDHGRTPGGRHVLFRVCGASDGKAEVSAQLKAETDIRSLTADIAPNRNLLRKLGFRPVPLPVKSAAIAAVYCFVSDRPVTTTMSDLGVVELPEEMRGHIERFEFRLGAPYANTTNSAVVTNGETVTLCFTGSQKNPYLPKAVCRPLREHNVPVTIRNEKEYQS